MDLSSSQVILNEYLLFKIPYLNFVLCMIKLNIVIISKHAAVNTESKQIIRHSVGMCRVNLSLIFSSW